MTYVRPDGIETAQTTELFKRRSALPPPRPRRDLTASFLQGGFRSRQMKGEPAGILVTYASSTGGAGLARSFAPAFGGFPKGRCTRIS